MSRLNYLVRDPIWLPVTHDGNPCSWACLHHTLSLFLQLNAFHPVKSYIFKRTTLYFTVVQYSISAQIQSWNI